MAFMGPSLPSRERAGHLLPLYSGRSGSDTWGVEPANTPRKGTSRRAGTGAPFLVELVDRQFSFLSTRDADRYLMTVSRVLTLLRREPMLAAILDDFDAEVRAAVADYHAHERHMMDELLALFRAVRPALLEAASAGIEGFDPGRGGLDQTLHGGRGVRTGLGGARRVAHVRNSVSRFSSTRR